MTKIKKIKSFLFENISTKQTVAKNTFWLFGGETISRLLKMVIVVYAARILGASGWGDFSYAIALSAFFMVFSDIGLSPLMTRDVVQRPEIREKYISTAFVIKLSILIPSVILVVALAPFFSSNAHVRSLFPLVALMFFFESLQSFGFGLNRALEKMEREALIKTGSNLLTVTLGFLFLVISPTASSLAMSYAFGGAIGLVALIITLKSELKDLFLHFTKNLVIPILLSAWPFAIMAILSSILINIDTVMIGWIKDSYDVGIYSVAQRPIQFFYMISNLGSAAIFPALSRFAKKEPSKFRETIEKSVTSLLLIGIPLVSGGIILAKEIMSLLFGNAYLSSAITFQILLITILPVFPMALFNGAIFAFGEQKKLLYFSALGSVTNIILNYILISKFGINGAATATVLTQTFICFLMWVSLKRINYFSLFSKLDKILISTIAMSLISLTLKRIGLHAVLNITLSSISYVIFLHLTKEKIIFEIFRIFRPKGANVPID